VPDYFENRPKPCMNGLGSIFLTITPDGTALPCHAAKMLPGLTFPNVRDASVEWIWRDSHGFNHYRGDSWMKEPCRSCPEKTKDGVAQAGLRQPVQPRVIPRHPDLCSYGTMA